MRIIDSLLARLILVLAYVLLPPLIVGCGSDKPLSPRLPPPGSDNVAFVSARDGNSEIYTVNIDGTDLARLTNNVAIDEFPAWSPDGQHIAFQSNRTGHFEIYVMNADGSDVVQRTFSASYSDHPTWSANGDTIAYSTLSDGSVNLWKVGAFSGSPTLLFSAPGWDGQPDWSPDGARLALSSDWNFYDAVNDIFLVSADGSGATGLTGGFPDDVNYVQPAWSPDGSKLSLAIVQTIGFDQYTTSLGLMNQDGSNLKPLASAAEWTRSSWSSDGQRIVYTSPTRSVVWMKADGSASDTIATDGWNADWRP